MGSVHGVMLTHSHRPRVKPTTPLQCSKATYPEARAKSLQLPAPTTLSWLHYRPSKGQGRPYKSPQNPKPPPSLYHHHRPCFHSPKLAHTQSSSSTSQLGGRMKVESTATVALLLFLLLAPPSLRVSMAGSGNRRQLHLHLHLHLMRQY